MIICSGGSKEQDHEGDTRRPAKASGLCRFSVSRPRHQGYHWTQALLSSVVRVYFLIGFRNRKAVALNWGGSYVTFQRGARLITGICGSA